jgi:hypothetical protein
MRYHRENHPCEYVHPDGYITIVAPDETTARLWFIRSFGNKFCSVHTPEQMEEIFAEHNVNYWPLGELHRYVIVY